MGQPRKPTPEKYCERCGVLLERKRFGDRLEDLNIFRRRRFCGLSCANSKETVGLSAHLWRSRKLRGLACEACWSTQSLQAHHIDQDQTNDAPSNIQTLCKPCHDFWHSTQKRRHWAIAGRMPLLIPPSETSWMEFGPTAGKTVCHGSPPAYPIGHTDLEV